MMVLNNDRLVDLPLSKMMDFVSWDDDYSQLNGKIKFMFQTTNQI
jgi:hypothetical protein